MKKICSILLGISLVVAIAIPVSAGSKSTASFSAKSTFNGVEVVNIKTNYGVIVNYDIKVDTNAWLTCNHAKGKTSNVTRQSYWSAVWDFATKGTVTGTIDGTSISFTDY